MPESSRQKALFAVGNVPPGGTCLSTFVIVTSGTDVLVGKMARPDIWTERFFVGKSWVDGYVASGKYVLPASHLAWYESPLDAANRIIKEMTPLRIPRKQVQLVEVQSYLSGNPKSQIEPPHWDICFLYEARVPKVATRAFKTPEWFEDLAFIERKKLSVGDFTRGHGDILRQARAIGRPATATKKRKSSL
jgi:ADP-ribose pyrophosphatase YjhB (NUDIX family)